jgi:hypothetical protein
MNEVNDAKNLLQHTFLGRFAPPPQPHTQLLKVPRSQHSFTTHPVLQMQGAHLFGLRITLPSIYWAMLVGTAGCCPAKPPCECSSTELQYLTTATQLECRGTSMARLLLRLSARVPRNMSSLPRTGFKRGAEKHVITILDWMQMRCRETMALCTLSPGTVPAPFCTQHEPQRRELHNAFSRSSQSTFLHAQCSSARGYQACYTT